MNKHATRRLGRGRYPVQQIGHFVGAPDFRASFLVTYDRGRRSRSLEKMWRGAPPVYAKPPFSQAAAASCLGISEVTRRTFREAISPWLRGVVSDAGECPALIALETKAADTQCPQIGLPPLGILPNDRLPWYAPDAPYVTRNYAYLKAAARVIGRHLRDAAAKGTSGHMISDTVFSASMTDVLEGRVDIRYRRGSNYGFALNIPGSSSLADEALVWYAQSSQATSRLAYSLLQTIRPDIAPDTHSFRSRHGILMSVLLGQVMSSRMGALVPPAMCDSVQVFTRTGPIKADKPAYGWSITGPDPRLILTGITTGVFPRPRWISGVNAARNVPFNPLARVHSDMARSIRGLHCGHALHNSADAYSLSVFCGMTPLHAHDLSKYDSTVSRHLAALYWDVMEGMCGPLPDFRSFDMVGRSLGITPVLLGCNPAITPSVTKSSAASDVSLSAGIIPVGNILSGEQTTTSKGTILHLLSIATGLSRISGINVDAVMQRCWNLTTSPIYPFNDGLSWGLQLKGDDVVYGLGKGWPQNTIDRLMTHLSDMGLVAEVEPGPVFLMNAYLPGSLEDVRSQWTVGVPQSIASRPGFVTSGIFLRRFGSLLFPENPPRHWCTAVLGLVDKSIGLQSHPSAKRIFPLFLETLARLPLPDSERSHLSRAISKGISGCHAYVNSSGFKEVLIEYSQQAGTADPFLKDALARSDISVDLQSALSILWQDHGASGNMNDAIEDMGFSSTLALSPLLQASPKSSPAQADVLTRLSRMKVLIDLAHMSDDAIDRLLDGSISAQNVSPHLTAQMIPPSIVANDATLGPISSEPFK